MYMCSILSATVILQNIFGEHVVEFVMKLKVSFRRAE